ncbi:Protein kinase delta type [Salix suchowensis]|nr:Protein kinase delta type [Salix suchowensis]
MEVLDAYIATDIDELSSYIIKFLHAFLTESPLLESYEVDNFVLRNGQVLCRWAWKAYAVQQFDISAIRPAFLLRTLVVDEEPFQALLDGLYQSSVDWKIRCFRLTEGISLDSVSRIFRIILETLSASFNVEGRQWRTSVANVFRKFFSAIWSDEKEEVRLEAKSLSRTLLPTHLLAIALCWDEALMKAPMSERVGITSFLIELHSHFPEWQRMSLSTIRTYPLLSFCFCAPLVLSWEVITEILSELNYTEKHGDAEDGPASAHLSMHGTHSENDDAGSVVGLDDEMSQLRRGVLLLSLRMIADGILVDNQTLIKVKLHLLQALGFDGVSTVTTGDGHNFGARFNEVRLMDAHMYPLVTELVAVLDSHHKFWQASTVNAPQMGLVEGLGIMIHKQDFEERPMRHLQQPLRKAVHRLHEVLLGEGSYEVRQLALSVTQAFIKKCPTFMGTIIM